MNEYITKKVSDLVSLQNEVRPGWNSDPKFIIKYLIEEAEEADEAIEKALIGDGPMEFAGEVGDVVYLGVELLRIIDKPTQIPLEVMKAWYRTVETALDVGINLNDAVLMKIFRNDLKYPLAFSNNGFKDSSDVRKYSKEQWAYMNGEVMFAIAFMQLGEDITHHTDEKNNKNSFWKDGEFL